MKDFAGLFPGQGSQTVGMGKALFESFPEARDLFLTADEVLGFSLSKLCFEGPLEELTLTQNAQPAILTTSYAAFKVAGLKPAAAAGHSLGEYSALVAAGAMRFEDAVRLVHLRGKFMQEAVPAGHGKMIAVLGPSVEELETSIAKVSVGVKEVANINCPGQTVIAGDGPGIDALSELLTTQGAKVIPLNVSAPFHCSLMKPAEEKLWTELGDVTFSDPAFPVYSNVSGKPVTKGSDIAELLRRQVCSPVRWTDSMLNLLKDTKATFSVEFGNGGVLSNLLKRIDKSVTRLEAFDSQSIEAAKAKLSA